MLGDSTDMVSYLPRESGPGYQLELLLRDRFHDRHVMVRNLAESGDYLKQLLESGRLDRELATLDRCDVMVIRYGLNDNKSATPMDFKAQLLETCGKVRTKFPGAQLVIATSLPPRGQPFEAVTREAAAELGVPLVDIAEHFRAMGKRSEWNWHVGTGTMIGCRTEENPADNPDGLKGNIHPNAFGSRQIAEQVFKVIEPIVEKRLEAERE